MSKECNYDGRGKYQEFAIDKFNLGNEVLKMIEDGFTYSHISSILKEKGYKVSYNAIGRWIRSNRKNVMSRQSKEVANLKNFEVLCVNYQQEITSILDEVKQVKEVARDAGKLDAYVKLVGKLYQGLELLAKLMGDIKPNGSVDINLVINEINQNTFDKYKSARKNLFDKGEIFDVDADVIEDDVNE